MVVPISPRIRASLCASLVRVKSCRSAFSGSISICDGNRPPLQTRMAKRALVTGGAGLIGSHVVDLLVRDGWQVLVLDNLEPQTHRRGRPTWINEKAKFVEGDLRDRDTITAAL